MPDQFVFMQESMAQISTIVVAKLQKIRLKVILLFPNDHYFSSSNIAIIAYYVERNSYEILGS